eukprot:g16383.t1
MKGRSNSELLNPSPNLKRDLTSFFNLCNQGSDAVSDELRDPFLQPIKTLEDDARESILQKSEEESNDDEERRQRPQRRAPLKSAKAKQMIAASSCNSSKQVLSTEPYAKDTNCVQCTYKVATDDLLEQASTPEIWRKAYAQDAVAGILHDFPEEWGAPFSEAARIEFRKLYRRFVQVPLLVGTELLWADATDDSEPRLDRKTAYLRAWEATDPKYNNEGGEGAPGDPNEADDDDPAGSLVNSKFLQAVERSDRMLTGGRKSKKAMQRERLNIPKEEDGDAEEQDSSVSDPSVCEFICLFMRGFLDRLKDDREELAHVVRNANSFSAALSAWKDASQLAGRDAAQVFRRQMRRRARSSPDRTSSGRGFCCSRRDRKNSPRELRGKFRRFSFVMYLFMLVFSRFMQLLSIRHFFEEHVFKDHAWVRGFLESADDFVALPMHAFFGEHGLYNQATRAVQTVADRGLFTVLGQDLPNGLAGALLWNNKGWMNNNYNGAGHDGDANSAWGGEPSDDSVLHGPTDMRELIAVFASGYRGSGVHGLMSRANSTLANQSEAKKNPARPPAEGGTSSNQFRGRGRAANPDEAAEQLRNFANERLEAEDREINRTIVPTSYQRFSRSVTRDPKMLILVTRGEWEHVKTALAGAGYNRIVARSMHDGKVVADLSISSIRLPESAAGGEKQEINDSSDSRGGPRKEMQTEDEQRYRWTLFPQTYAMAEIEDPDSGTTHKAVVPIWHFLDQVDGAAPVTDVHKKLERAVSDAAIGNGRFAFWLDVQQRVRIYFCSWNRGWVRIQRSSQAVGASRSRVVILIPRVILHTQDRHAREVLADEMVEIFLGRLRSHCPPELPKKYFARALQLGSDSSVKQLVKLLRGACLNRDKDVLEEEARRQKRKADHVPQIRMDFSFPDIDVEMERIWVEQTQTYAQSLSKLMPMEEKKFFRVVPSWNV